MGIILQIALSAAPSVSAQPAANRAAYRADVSCLKAPAKTVEQSSAINQGQPTGITIHNEVVAVGRDDDFHCSGVLVGPQLVLTARHCLPATRVLFGESVRCGERVILVSSTEAAPGDQLDAALLTLAEVAPVALAKLSTAGKELPPAPELRIVGFGADDPKGRRGFGVRRYADLLSPQWRCTPLRARALGCDPATELVVFQPGSKDTCDGDSGGALYLRQNGENVLVGITSRALRNARVRCGAGGVYLRIAAVDDWLNSRLHPARAKTSEEEQK